MWAVINRPVSKFPIKIELHVFGFNGIGEVNMIFQRLGQDSVRFAFYFEVNVSMFSPTDRLRCIIIPRHVATNNNSSGSLAARRHQGKCSVSSPLMQQKPSNNAAGRLHARLVGPCKLMNAASDLPALLSIVICLF